MAAKQPAKTPAPPTVPAGTRSRGFGGAATIPIVIGTIMAVTALPMCILFVLGMLPTITAAIVDRRRGRYLARAVAAMNLAGMVQPVIQLLHIGMSLAGVQHVLSDARTWLVMYGAAAIGWLLNLGMPSMARILVDVRADQMQRQLEARSKELVAEWGDDVAGRKAESARPVSPGGAGARARQL